MSYSEKTTIVDSSKNVIDPASESTLILLRRIAKLLESNAVVDYANRQRVIVDYLTLTTTTVSNITANGGNDPRYQFMDGARMAYGTGIRSQLIFT